ncbi:MAG: sensor histidine kinase N-terminal domain-containing protein [Betaproteobacteria bacterium]|nr:sensor histidine kinase N-terminal domain-containing protein [Betaproteobacteria bacterium]
MSSNARSLAPARRASLFSKILEWMLVPLLVIWPAAIGIAHLKGVALANESFDRTLGSDARALAEQIAWSPAMSRFTLLADLRTLLSDDELSRIAFRLDDANGQLALGDEQLPAVPVDAGNDSGTVTFRSGNLRGKPVRIATLIRAVDGSPTRAVLQIAETLERRESMSQEIVKGVVAPQLLVIPLSIILIWLGLKTGLAPLERLRRQVAARALDDVRPLDVREAPTEVAALIEAFNELLQRIDRSNTAHKRFIANAAHQLRTPLAGIQTQTELALRQHADRTDDATRAALQRIAEGTAKSTHLITQLLMLARADADSNETLKFETVDLAAAVGTVIAEAYSRAAAKSIDLGLEAPTEKIQVQAHPLLFAEMLANLVDNAIRYSEPGGRVTVRYAHPASPVIDVEDDGRGIPESERQLVFERFYRGGHSSESGTGIGLAIVKEIAQRHNADIEILTPSSGRGTLIRIRFPAAGEPAAS